MSKFSFDTINDFDNHISDSIFGYDILHSLIVNLSSYFLNEKTTIVDIGCTSGKLLNLLVSKYNCKKSYGYDITDNNFIESNCNLIKQDVTDINFEIPKNDACYSVFTLQFIEPLKRIELLRKIYESLNIGGFFIFCEKEYSKDGQINEMFTFVNYDYKKKKFSSEDILNKEKDLREIMKPFNSNVNYALLVESGFITIEQFFQSLNFKGYICRK